VQLVSHYEGYWFRDRRLGSRCRATLEHHERRCKTNELLVCTST
jgi:hypothetical protein